MKDEIRETWLEALDSLVQDGAVDRFTDDNGEERVKITDFGLWLGDRGLFKVFAFGSEKHRETLKNAWLRDTKLS